MAAGRDNVESFVIESIRQTLLDPLFEERITEHLKDLSRLNPEVGSSAVSALNKRIEGIAKRIRTVVSAIEAGAPVDQFLGRHKEPKAEEESLSAQKEEMANQLHKGEEIENISALVDVPSEENSGCEQPGCNYLFRNRNNENGD